jgi:hypothetical protein
VLRCSEEMDRDIVDGCSSSYEGVMLLVDDQADACQAPTRLNRSSEEDIGIGWRSHRRRVAHALFSRQVAK